MSSNNVTFVIPVYIKNKEYLKFFDQTIKGLLDQIDEKWSAIIIEDCSPTVEVKELLLNYINLDKRIDAVFLKKRVSTGECRNIGIKWAVDNGADIIIYNDADDISSPDRVKTVKKIFHDNPNVSIIYSRVKIIDEFSKEVKKEKIAPPIMEILEELKENQPTGKNCWYSIGIKTGYINVTSATAVRANLALQELFPDEYISEDSHTWFRYTARGEMYFCDKVLTYYRIPSYVIRQSSNSYVEDFNKNKIRVEWDGFSKALDIAEGKGELGKSKRNLIEAKFLLRLAESMVKDGRVDLVYDLTLRCKERLDLISDNIINS